VAAQHDYRLKWLRRFGGSHTPHLRLGNLESGRENGDNGDTKSRNRQSVGDRFHDAKSSSERHQLPPETHIDSAGSIAFSKP
jgi:hypothetical protein